MWVIVEGLDGSGKTTAIEYIARRAAELGKDVVMTKGIGSGEIGSFLRGKILEDEYTDEKMNELAFPLALMDCARVSVNALNLGKLVITDRFVASYYAYSKYKDADHPFRNKLVRNVEKYAQDLVNGEHTIVELFINTPINTCIDRIRFRGVSNKLDNASREEFLRINSNFKDYFSVSDVVGREITNAGSLGGFYTQLNGFIDDVIDT